MTNIVCVSIKLIFPTVIKNFCKMGQWNTEGISEFVSFLWSNAQTSD